MIDGCLLNVREWLRRHTWIQWYIRNEKGHLRPLWEILSRRGDRRPLSKGDDAEDDSRWKGYNVLEHRGYKPRWRSQSDIDYELERTRRELGEVQLREEGEQRRRAQADRSYYESEDAPRERERGVAVVPRSRSRSRSPLRDRRPNRERQPPRVVRIQIPPRYREYSDGK
jgi:hypothetical protein